MRRSARDVGKAGWDQDTGYGILDVPAALTRKPPAVDPQEPNEDVYLVKPNGLTRDGKTPLTAQHRPRATISAQLERREDPEDVYRIYLPAKGKVVVTVRPNANVSLELWGKKTKTVFEQGAAREARPARRLGPCGRAVRAHHADGPRLGPVRLRGRVPAEDRRAGLVLAQRRSRRTLAAV